MPTVLGTTTVRVIESFGALVQDLGRVGHEKLGVNRSGASDVFSARAANLLAGNAPDAPLVEITDSRFIFEAEQTVTVAVTGARSSIVLDGEIRLPAWEPLTVPAGTRLDIAPPTQGYRVYVAFSGAVRAENLLGSVSPLPARGFENPVSPGGLLEVGTPANPPLRPGAAAHLAPLIDRLLNPGRIGVLQTAQAEVFDRMERLYAKSFSMNPRSNAVGARFDGETPVRRDTTEITSRSVPIGSVEIPAAGELIVLLRGRLITAGYPIPAVIARAAIDAVAQLRPGGAVRVERILHQEAALHRLSEN
jgi:biotin-dependent carboxylase-like uncharacterized protein